MVYKVYSGRVGGVFGDLITVEVDASGGLPGVDIIGLPGSDVKEARDRVRVALKNSGINFPATRIIINLSPADEHKEGAGFDLPIAVALLGVFGRIGSFRPDECLVIGGVSLDGEVLGVSGVLPIVRMASERGFKRVIVPAANADEAFMIKGIEIIPATNLSDLILFLSGSPESPIKPYAGPDFEAYLEKEKDVPDFKDVVGQEAAKRAAGIAAAGLHHLLMVGPPGTGKSLIAARIPGILPKLTYEESLEVTTVHSVAGYLDEKHPFVIRRPFFAPHHGASPQALAGGSANARPGLASLCHRGVLFLDEMPEFRRESIDALRQPLEDGKITVSRARHTYVYPAKFMLVGAMNPCPCGYYPDRNRCSCTQVQIAKYLARISGPIADRIDICVEVSRMEPKEIASGERGMTTEDLRERVTRAVEAQKLRYAGESFKFNSLLPASKINDYVPLSGKERDYSFSLYESMGLSMRAFYKLLRVARTIADFDGDERVETRHLAEASCYRFPEYMGG